MFASCGEEASESESSTKEIVKKEVPPIQIGNLEVMRKDLGEMNWPKAKKSCAALGGGWRLPTKGELEMLYENKDKIGGFVNDYYWSSTEFIGAESLVWKLQFDFGKTGSGVKKSYESNYVRAVRSI